MNVGELVGILRLDDQMAEGTRAALNAAERRFGQGGDAAGDRFVRGADGKIRDTLTGKFARAGDLAGTEFGREASDAMASEMEGGGGSKIAGALGAVGTGVLGAAGAAGALIGGALVVGLMGAMDDQAGDDLLAARLGLDGEGAAAAGRAAAEVYTNNFGENLDEARTAVDAVWSGLGDHIGDAEDAIPRAAERALTLAQILGVDVTEAANTAGVMIESGLARDAEHAFDLMTDGAQKMPAMMRGELIPIVEEYSTFLADMGISGEEAFDLLAEASKKGGTFGIDKMGDALKELGIRATDMSTASVDAYHAAGLDASDMAARFVAGGEDARGALGDLVDGLQGIDDPVARANAAIGLFGTPLEDMSVTDIPEFLDQLDQMGTGVEDVAGKTDEAAATIGDNATSKIETFKRKGLMALTDFVGGKALPAIERFADRAGPMVDGLLEAWKTDGFSGVADQLGEMWDEAWPKMQTRATALFERAREWVVENGPRFLRGGGEMASRLWDWLQDAWPPFARHMAGLYGKVASWFAETGVPAAGEWLKAAGPRLWEWLQDAYPSFVKSMAGLLTTIGVWILTTGVPWVAEKGFELWSALGEWLWTEAVPALLAGLLSLILAAAEWISATAIPWLREKGSELWGSLVRTAQERGPELLAWLQSLPGMIGGYITGTAVPLLREKAAEWFGSMRTAAEAKGDELVGWLRGLPGRALGALGNVGSALYETGRDLIEGLLNGIRAMAGRIADAVMGPIRGAIDGAKNLLGINSPSRVFAEIGRNTAAGFVLGAGDSSLWDFSGAVRSAVEVARRQLMEDGSYRLFDAAGNQLFGQGAFSPGGALAGVDRVTASSIAGVVRSIDSDVSRRMPGRGPAGSGGTWSESQIDYDRLAAALAKHPMDVTVVSELDGEKIGRNRAVGRGVASQIVARRTAVA